METVSLDVLGVNCSMGIFGWIHLW